ncbi:type I-E CRISPR-associated endoribonuclease Cas2e [Corynebacterium anserum]|uniref:Type I-E CRISPR-associated endoribonuclease Cas2 n=1 Tax=Corynebacterium anserum TaxID=2684406 RepID=A0A7G7YLS2_9CORY|nr:type I-E CRISPR-associated endoribonuclease Cas2e [Corynebacterium anserum]MBC2681394.1 type I-E CRISPR-associated endoribonuclease Cas2 [Corynebacterium anserum]QNH95442.1 type I-E CRISPR-associated endoribonuclease Cas2 [Corynebacterium anserum]
MMVLTVTAVPAGLRGDLTKWLMEIAPGVFVGDPSARIRDLLWERTIGLCKDGRALLIYSSDNEQGMEFRTHRHNWEPTDFDGITLMMRPSEKNAYQKYPRRTGWSTARNARRRR